MANTSAVYARIDNDLKKEAESILGRLGITPSSAIQMLYSQIVLNRGLPFVPRIPRSKPLAIGDLTCEQLDAEIKRGIDSLSSGQGIPEEQVDAIFAEEFGV